MISPIVLVLHHLPHRGSIRHYLPRERCYIPIIESVFDKEFRERHILLNLTIGQPLKTVTFDIVTLFFKTVHG